MKKSIWYSICVLLLFIPSFGVSAQASGKTQTHITFTQGEQPNKSSIDQVINKDNIKGILPHTGEQLSLFLIVMGVCFLSYVYLKNKRIRKKE